MQILWWFWQGNSNKNVTFITVNYFHIPRNFSHKSKCDVEINVSYSTVWLTEKRATRRLLLITQFVDFVNKILSDTHILLEGLILLFLLLLILLLCWNIDIMIGGRNSVVGIAICYGPDGVGIKTRWAIFSVLFHNVPKTSYSLYKIGTGFFQW